MVLAYRSVKGVTEGSTVLTIVTKCNVPAKYVVEVNSGVRMAAAFLRLGSGNILFAFLICVILSRLN